MNAPASRVRRSSPRLAVMMVIPADLPSALAPVAWMLGTWKGWGMHARVGAEPDEAVIEEIRCDIVGERMRMTTSIYQGNLADGVELDALWEAGEGLKRIGRGKLLTEETLYMEVLPGSGQLPEPGTYEPREFTATSAWMNGIGVLWAGIAMGPRLRMSSDTLARGPRAEDVTRFGRMYGLVGGELLWTQERSLGRAEAEVEFSGRLMRTSQARGASGETLEGFEAEGEDDARV